MVLVSLAADTITSCCCTVLGYPFPNLHIEGQVVDAMCISPPGGVLLPSGVPGSDGGGGDAHQTGAG